MVFDILGVDGGEFVVQMVITFAGSLLTLVAGWWLFVRQRKAQGADEHRAAVRRLYLALAQVEDAEYLLVMSQGMGDVTPHIAANETKQLERAVGEAKGVLSHTLNHYLETWSGEDVSVPRRVQAMCSLVLRPVLTRNVGIYHPADLAGHVINELANYHPHLGHLRPTDEDRKAVWTLLEHDMGGPA